MPFYPVVRCVRCPFQKDYVELDSCNRCQFYVGVYNGEVQCRYEGKTLSEEKTVDREYETKW